MLLAYGLHGAGGVQGRRQGHQADRPGERVPKTDGEAETVEDRQARQQHRLLGQDIGVLDLAQVREEVAVGKLDPLGFAGTTAREEQGGLLVPAPARQPQERGEGPGRQQSRGEEGRQHIRLPESLEFLGDVEATVAPREVGELLQELGPERFGGDDEVDLRAAQARSPLLAAERVVEVHRHLAREETGEVRDRGADARREDDAHPAGGREATEPTGHDPPQGEQRGAGELTATDGAVDEGDATGLADQPMHDLATEVAVQRFVLGEGLAGEFEQAQAGGGVLGGRERRPDDHMQRTREVARKLPEELAAAVAEDRTPQPIDDHRDDRHAGPARDELVAPTQRQHAARAGEAALGEDADDLAARQGVGRPLDRVLGLLLGDRHGPHHARDHAHHRHALETFPGEEAYRPAEQDADDDGVHVGDMVADDQRAAGGRQVLQSLGPDAVEELAEDEAGRLHGAIADAHGAVLHQELIGEDEEEERRRDDQRDGREQSHQGPQQDKSEYLHKNGAWSAARPVQAESFGVDPLRRPHALGSPACATTSSDGCC